MNKENAKMGKNANAYVKLVLVRHGESEWNNKKIFTGWTDIDLTSKGTKEAKEAGRTLKKNNIKFETIYTSYLKRAIRTMWIILDEMDLMWKPVQRSWRLNERHYGALQGLSKPAVSKKHGYKQFMKWRRGFDTRPPALKKTDERYPGKDPMYSTLKKSELPTTESLKDTIKRVMPYWKTITTQLKKKQNVMIVAHGNSLRALVKHMDKISDNEINYLNIPTGIPLIYELDKNLKPIKHYYLGDKNKIRKLIEQEKQVGKHKK